METNHPPHAGNQSGLDRKSLFRSILYDARLEFARLEGPPKIVDAGLLTAMGALGATRGFACLLPSETQEARIAYRGVDPETIAYFKDHFSELEQDYFASIQWNQAPFESRVRIIDSGDPPGHPLGASGLQLLIHWRMEKELAGFMMLGDKITGLSFETEEIDFVLNVIDSMGMALRAATAQSVIRTLQSELLLAREQIREATLRNEAAKKELERTLFRLSGFNDIFQELSGLHESQRVIESFLLILIGIFSSKHGSILYFDGAIEKSYMAHRGSGASAFSDMTPEQIRRQVESGFANRRASALAPMQAEIMPEEHLAGPSSHLARGNLVIIFKIDETAKGLLCLGPRLVDSQYGARERELLLAFIHNFLVFLNNSKSFETIQRLNAEQEQKNIDLQQTVLALTASKSKIVSLEKAGQRIKSLITRTMLRTTKVSPADICAILAAGVILGLVYNFASPGGIPIIPVIWRHPSSPPVDIYTAKKLYSSRTALFVDARPPEFYNQEHIAQSVNLPPALFDFVYMMRFSRLDPQQSFVIYGRTISRHYDAEIAYRLRDRGHTDVQLLTGGIAPWKAQGLPTEP